VVKSTRNKAAKSKGRGKIKMQIRKQLINKIESLPEDKLDEIADFIEFVETRGNKQSALVEYGMGDYLHQLSAYEEMLAAGKIERHIFPHRVI
jgi:hypothetical protein